MYKFIIEHFDSDAHHIHMPIYEYKVKDGVKGCEYCTEKFEVTQKISDERLKNCPKCGAVLEKVYSVPSVGHSKTGLDQRAKAAGFSKLKRLGKGEYEKMY